MRSGEFHVGGRQTADRSGLMSATGHTNFHVLVPFSTIVDYLARGIYRTAEKRILNRAFSDEIHLSAEQLLKGLCKIEVPIGVPRRAVRKIESCEITPVNDESRDFSGRNPKLSGK
jgi:hypothetical protein